MGFAIGEDEVASMGAGDGAGDGQAQPRTTGAPTARAFAALERLHYLFEKVLRHTRAIIFNDNPDKFAIAGRADPR